MDDTVDPRLINRDIAGQMILYGDVVMVNSRQWSWYARRTIHGLSLGVIVDPKPQRQPRRSRVAVIVPVQTTSGVVWTRIGSDSYLKPQNLLVIDINTLAYPAIEAVKEIREYECYI